MTYEEIAKILDKNGVEYGRWTKGNMDRIYINNDGEIYMNHVNLEVHYYKTGNISRASLNGEEISHAEAHRQMLAEGYYPAKCWIDLADGSVHTKNYTQNGEKLQKIIEDMLAAELEEEVEEQAAETQEVEEQAVETVETENGELIGTAEEIAEAEAIIEKFTAESAKQIKRYQKEVDKKEAKGEDTVKSKIYVKAAQIVTDRHLAHREAKYFIDKAKYMPRVPAWNKDFREASAELKAQKGE